MHDRSDLGSNKGSKHFCLDVIIIRFLFLISLVSQSALFLIHFFTFIVSFIIGSQPICSLFVSLVYNCVQHCITLVVTIQSRIDTISISLILHSWFIELERIIFEVVVLFTCYL